jgi:hypothetical protein
LSTLDGFACGISTATGVATGESTGFAQAPQTLTANNSVGQ